jgi:hypothetical protein
MANTYLILFLYFMFFLSLSRGFYLGPEKFHFLLLQSTRSQTEVATKCNEILSRDTSAHAAGTSWSYIAGRCADHRECMLGNMTENGKAYISAASILLGLTPIMLSTLALTVSEIGLLLLNRPVLSLILSLGTASVFTSRDLGYSNDDAAEILSQRRGLPNNLIRRLQRSRKMRYTLSVMQYIVTMVSVANVMNTSWQLGLSTVTSI